MNRYHTSARIVLLILVIAALVGELRAEILISESGLSGAAGQYSDPIDFSVPENVGSAIMTITGPNTGSAWRVQVGIAYVGDPEVKTVFRSVGKNKYEITGLRRGDWVAVVYGVTKYANVGFSIDGIASQPPQPPEPPVDDLTRVTDLPAIMDANGWTRGAVLLRHWFGSTGTLDNTTIRMEWALQFPLCKAKFNQIFREKVYINKKGREEIMRNLGDAAPGEYIVHANFLKDKGKYFGILKGDIDEFDVAIHGFALNAEVKVDYLAPDEKGRRFVVVKEVGVYLYDMFEFGEDDDVLEQPLGVWNKATNYVGTRLAKGTYFDNADFRTYTAETGIGKNFEIKSPILWKKLNKPQRFLGKDVK